MAVCGELAAKSHTARKGIQSKPLTLTRERVSGHGLGLRASFCKCQAADAPEGGGSDATWNWEP